MPTDVTKSSPTPVGGDRSYSRATAGLWQNVIALLAIAFIVCLLLAVGISAASALPVQDLAQYWAGAHLITVNPYSQDLVTAFERHCGVIAERGAMVMRNPPQSLLIVLPLRFFSYRLAFAVWDLLSIVLIAGCARTAYNLASKDSSLAPAILSLLFGPTVALLMLGQIVIVVLLGLTLFLHFVERRKDWLAGAALFLIVPKPHLLVLFVVAVTCWTVHKRRWAVLLSAMLATMLATVLVLFLNPHVFAQYIAFAREFSHENTPYPNLGGLLYTLSGIHALAYIPLLGAIVWLGFYWARFRHVWDWKDHGMTVLVVSVASSYYSFAFDQILMIPALMIGLALRGRMFLYAGLAVTNLGYALYISGAAGRYGFGPMFLWWTSLSLAAAYLMPRLAEGALPAAETSSS